jgi:hypothetical protein
VIKNIIRFFFASCLLTLMFSAAEAQKYNPKEITEAAKTAQKATYGAR